MKAASDADSLCVRCHVRRSHFALDGQPMCLWCALRHVPMLQRSFLTALIVGSLQTLINQGDVLLGGNLPWVLAWKIPLTFSIPFLVATWGGLVNSRPKRQPSAAAGTAHS